MSGISIDAAGAAHAWDDSSTRYVPPWRNPWRKPYFLSTITWLYVLWSIVPVLISIQFSFNDGRSRSSWQGFTTKWYCCGGEDGSVASDHSLLLSLQNSVTLAVATVIVSVPIGTALALGLTRWRSRTSKAANGISLFPLVTPELVLGGALYLIMSTLYVGIGLGKGAMLLGHVTFSLSFVLVIVRSRLLSIGGEYETAAQDLGATRMQAIRTILLPLLMPAVFASAMITFAGSLDDFVVSSFLYGDASNITVPIKLYSAVKASPSPALNALATLLLMGTLFALLVMYVVLRFRNRKEGGSAMDEIAAFEM
ncbi:MAG TPA: ABC transporter permease [Actinomycetes bacterium]|nr:ABC transporter permease [Actinomycetes bacterium]